MLLASSVGKKPKKSTEDSVIYLLGNPQRDVGDWLTLRIIIINLIMSSQSGSLKSYLRSTYGVQTQKAVDSFGKDLQRHRG